MGRGAAVGPDGGASRPTPLPLLVASGGGEGAVVAEAAESSVCVAASPQCGCSGVDCVATSTYVRAWAVVVVRGIFAENYSAKAMLSACRNRSASRCRRESNLTPAGTMPLWGRCPGVNFQRALTLKFSNFV